MELRVVSLAARRREGEEGVVCFCTGGRKEGKVVDFSAYRRQLGLEVPAEREAPPREGRAMGRLRWAALAAETAATLAVAVAALGMMCAFCMG